MPYRELTMIDVKEVLRCWSAGHGDRKIARASGADRKTIARYTKAAKSLGLERGCTLTDELVHEVARCVQARPLATPSDEWNEVARHRPLIERWLAGPSGYGCPPTGRPDQGSGGSTATRVLFELAMKPPPGQEHLDEAPGSSSSREGLGQALGSEPHSPPLYPAR